MTQPQSSPLPSPVPARRSARSRWSGRRIGLAAAAAVLLTAGVLIWAGVLSIEASVSTSAGEGAPAPAADAPAVRDTPAPGVRTTAAAMGAAVVAGRELVDCVRAKGVADCRDASIVHDVRGLGAPLTADGLDAYASTWVGRVVVVRGPGSVAVVAFDEDGLGVGYQVRGASRVRAVCYSAALDCTGDAKARAFMGDTSRLASVVRRPTV